MGKLHWVGPVFFVAAFLSRLQSVGSTYVFQDHGVPILRLLVLAVPCFTILAMRAGNVIGPSGQQRYALFALNGSAILIWLGSLGNGWLDDKHLDWGSGYAWLFVLLLPAAGWYLWIGWVDFECERKRKAKRKAEQSKYAAVWQRILAYFIDCLIAAIWIVPLAVYRDWAVTSGTQSPEDADAFCRSLGSGLTWIYFAGMESTRADQGTIGKMAVGIAVVNRNGKKIGFGRASARYFAAIIITSVTFGLAFLIVAFTPRRQALHDIITGCCVIPDDRIAEE